MEGDASYGLWPLVVSLWLIAAFRRELYQAAQGGRLATTGPPRWVRHPQ